MNRPAPASLRSATPKKNVPCFLDLAGVKFFLKKERTFFFGVLPSRSRAGGGTNAVLGFGGRGGVGGIPPNPRSDFQKRFFSPMYSNKSTIPIPLSLVVYSLHHIQPD